MPRRAAIVLLPAVLLALAAAVAPSAAQNKKHELSNDEKKLVELTNAERKKEKLPPLKINLVLSQVARKHSENMAKQNKMDHVLDDKNPLDRVKASGYRYGYVGENIAYGENVSLETIMESWMNSPPHRKNILKKEFTEIGLGAAKSAKGVWYYTQVFGTPRGR